MNTQTTVPVALGERSYEIHIGKNLLAQAGQWIAPLLKRKRVFVITDESVKSLHGAACEAMLQAEKITPHWLVIPAGEGSKTLATAQTLIANILEHAPERHDLVLALGGGVVGDLAGFVASIVLRGIPFVQIPTTLLAMVDSSVGGKTGVNAAQGKNLIGSFYQPKAVIADLSLLQTLPAREILAGYAEIMKYGLLGDAPFFSWLEKNYQAVLAQNADALTHAVAESCRKKAAIVAADEREGNVRALLNLGHTFGHALEKRTGYSDKLLHGEAVALGMVLAFDYSAMRGFCSVSDADRVRAHTKAVGLPYDIKSLNLTASAHDLVADMLQDKKVQGGKLTLILAKAIGMSFVTSEEEVGKVEGFLKDEG